MKTDDAKLKQLKKAGIYEVDEAKLPECEEGCTTEYGETCDDCPECGGCYMGEELWDYIPDDIFPEEAAVKGRHKYLRETEWIEVDKVNESNKKIVDEYINFFKEKYPEKAAGKTDFEILTENDDIWEHGLYDDLLSNSLINGDYVLDTYSKDDSKRYKRGNEYAKNMSDLTRQFDVVIQQTIVGRVCQPFIVFGIKYKHAWGAEERYDDYAGEKLHELQEWRRNQERDTIKEYREFEIQMFKDGHIHFELKDYGVTYVQAVRKVNHKAEKHKVSHDIW